MLRFDRGLSARWTRPDAARPAGPPDGCTLFFFRWEPGHASAAQADMHQPHICLTASGLTMTADHGTTPLALPDGLTLPVRRYEFVWHGQPIYVFFVVWQDGIGQQTPRRRAHGALGPAARRPRTPRQPGPSDAGVHRGRHGRGRRSGSVFSSGKSVPPCAGCEEGGRRKMESGRPFSTFRLPPSAFRLLPSAFPARGPSFKVFPSVTPPRPTPPAADPAPLTHEDILALEQAVLRRRRWRRWLGALTGVALVACVAFGALPALHAVKAWQARRLAASARQHIDQANNGSTRARTSPTPPRSGATSRKSCA